MPKRLTATEKWDDPWYSALSPIHRNFWDFLCDKCDIAGVWQVNMILVKAYFGSDFELPDFGDRVVKISAEKWWLKKFVQFQYGALNPANRVHQAVISRLPKEGACKGLVSPLPGVKEKEKEKDSSLGGSRGRELFDLWNSVITAPLQLAREFSDSRRKSSDARLKERPIGQWKEIIERVNKSAFCRGQNDRGWTANLDWLLRPDTAVKVLEGKYDDRKNGSSIPEHLLS